MKRKVGELNNIPIVEGDPNLLKSNEILHKGGGQLSKRNKEGSIEDLASGSSSNFPYRISYFKVNRSLWDDVAEKIVRYYPIIATLAGEVDGKIFISDINLYDSNLITQVPLFCVVHWDITIPPETINLNKILKSFEGTGIENYIEEITQEEYNNLRNQV